MMEELPPGHPGPWSAVEQHFSHRAGKLLIRRCALSVRAIFRRKNIMNRR